MANMMNKMLVKDKILKETSPLSIFFVKSGSGGNRLLFRYPYDESFQYDPELGLFAEQPLVAQEQDWLQFQSVINEDDEALCNLFSVHPNLCGQKFEIKINSVRHVGHPMSLLVSTSSLTPSNNHSQNSTTYDHQSNQSMLDNHRACRNLDLASYDCLTAPSNRAHQQLNRRDNRGDITSFNIVCALRSSASYDIVDCYYDLSKRLAIALSFEERRCSYLSKEIKTILSTLDESDMAEADRDQQESLHQSSLDHTTFNDVDYLTPGLNGAMTFTNIRNQQSVFKTILDRSNLARDLKRVFINLSTNGIVDLKINHWISVSFCLPQKVHRLKLMTHKSMPAIGTKDIKKCLMYLRPYHGLLLLQEPEELLDSLPLDASPAFIQLIKVIKPDKNFMELSVDANLTLMQIFQIVSQLIYWAKATVIYPICDSNIYAIHPLASTSLNSKLAKDFRTRFPTCKSLHHYLADFSEGISLSQLNGPLLSLDEKSLLLSIVTWLLQRRILIQIHKYIFLVVDRESPWDEQMNSDAKHQTISEQSSNNTLSSLTNISPKGGIEINVSQHSGAQSTDNCHHCSRTSYSGSCGHRNDHQAHRSNGRLRGSSFNTTSDLDKSRNYSPHLLTTTDSSSNKRLPGALDNGGSPGGIAQQQQRFRTNSFPEDHQDGGAASASVASASGGGCGQLGLSLSSTPNSNCLDYPSPGNMTDNAHIIRGSSLSSSCPLDDDPLMDGLGSESLLNALRRAGLSQAGIKEIISVPSSKNLDDLKLLIRLMAYFDGRHHVEDIMFFENLERSQVLILCDKFRDILYTCHYDDVAVCQLSPSNNQ